MQHQQHKRKNSVCAAKITTIIAISLFVTIAALTVLTVALSIASFALARVMGVQTAANVAQRMVNKRLKQRTCFTITRRTLCAWSHLARFIVSVFHARAAAKISFSLRNSNVCIYRHTYTYIFFGF